MHGLKDLNFVLYFRREENLHKKIIYKNGLTQAKDIDGWVKEGKIKISFDEGMILENGAEESLGDHAHWTYWLPQDFPENIEVEWKFKPLREPGLGMIFFAAAGLNGESIFSEHLEKRNGYYPQYHSGDINVYHISYFRHKNESELAFRTCNLRKSKGFYLVAQGADPLPPAKEALDFYQMKLIKFHNTISFYINELKLFEWNDDGAEYGPVLKKGKIGFRQMAPMKAIYKDLVVYELF